MLIRPALPFDLGPLLVMGRDFWEYAGCEAQGLGFSDADFALTLEDLATEGLLLVAEEGPAVVGMLGASIQPWYGRHADKIAQEWFLWVDDGHTGAGRALLEAFETWAREQGAAVCSLSTPGPTGRDEAVQRLWRQRGYVYGESQWILRVKEG